MLRKAQRLLFAFILSTLVSSAGIPEVREAAVAGLYYPAASEILSQEIDRLLASSRIDSAHGKLRALICPHAGYRYSGPVSASAYRLLSGQDFSTVLLLGPSHYATTRDAVVSAARAWRTPLGDASVAMELAATLSHKFPFAPETPSAVHRPEWWKQSHLSDAIPEEDTPHTWEHSLEVQIPFLQKQLPYAKLVPVVFGFVDDEDAASALAPLVDDQTLIIVSSDLSHYDTYERAQARDHRCIESICRLEPAAISTADACGAIPIKTLLRIAKAKRWEARLLDYRNSGDTSGEKTHGVVGYAAIAFFAPEPPSASYSAEERSLLLRLARQALLAATSNSKNASLNPPPSPHLAQSRGCFVTLQKNGALRGCIGTLAPSQPLFEAVVANTRSAALNDSRFSPVVAAEVDDIRIEISVLSNLTPLSFDSPDELLHQLRPGVDGVVLREGHRQATYLPQVWEQIQEKEEFLSSLCRKAGCESSAWKSRGTAVSVYQVETFAESP